MKNNSLLWLRKIINTNKQHKIEAFLEERIEPQFLLSIAIPSFGYPKELKDNVKELLQIENDDVEIVVLDNDTTGKEIKEFCLGIKDRRFHYYQNEKNIGRSNNIIKAIEKSNAEFVMLTSCDDRINKAAINIILEIIRKNNNCSMIIGRYIDDKGNAKSVINHEKIGTKVKKGINATCFFYHISNLIPIVINKRYINCAELYDINEIYMQYRIALIEAMANDVVYIDEIFAITKWVDIYDKKNLPEVLEKDRLDSVSWGIGSSYADPRSRASQFQGHIEVILERIKNKQEVLKYIDFMINGYINGLHKYAINSHDPIQVQYKCANSIMSYQEAFEIFKNSMSSFFEEKSGLGYFDYRSVFIYKMKKELDKCRYADRILDSILKAKNIYYVGTDSQSERMEKVLNIMGHPIKGYIDVNEGASSSFEKKYKINEIEKNSVVFSSIYSLYNLRYARKIEKTVLQKEGNIYFVNNMDSYLLSVWLSRKEQEKLVHVFPGY